MKSSASGSTSDSYEPEEKPCFGDGKSILRKLYIDLCNLIVESRVPGLTDRGYGAGTHCPPLLGPNTHCCDLSKPECQKHQRLVHRLLRAVKKNVFEIEVLMLPDCCQESKLCENIQNKEYILLERWSLDCIHSQVQSAIDVTQLLRAVRSFLYFSQISAWLSSTRGKSPSNIYYWIKLSADVTTTMFECEPDVHSFPICKISEELYGTVRVKYRARAQYIPIIPCSKHPPQDGSPLRTLVENSDLCQNISSDDHVKQILKACDTSPQTALSVNNCVSQSSSNDINSSVSQSAFPKAFSTDASGMKTKRILKHSNSQSDTPNVYSTVPKIPQGEDANKTFCVASKSKTTILCCQGVYTRNPSQENLSLDHFPPSKHLCKGKLRKSNELPVCSDRERRSNTLQSSLNGSLTCHLTDNSEDSDNVQSLVTNPQSYELNVTKTSYSSEKITLLEEKSQNDNLPHFQENSHDGEVNVLLPTVCKADALCLLRTKCNISSHQVKCLQRCTNIPEPDTHVVQNDSPQKKFCKRKACNISKKVKFQRIGDASESDSPTKSLDLELHIESASISSSHAKINSDSFDNLQQKETDSKYVKISEQLNSCKTENEMECANISYCMNPNVLPDNGASMKNGTLDLKNEMHASSSKCEVSNKVSNSFLYMRNNKAVLKLSRNLLKLSLKNISKRNSSSKSFSSSPNKYSPCRYSIARHDQSVQLKNSTNILRNPSISEEFQMGSNCKTDDSSRLYVETERTSNLTNSTLRNKSKITKYVSLESATTGNCHTYHRRKCSFLKMKSPNFKQKCPTNSIRKLANDSTQFNNAFKINTSGQNTKVNKTLRSKFSKRRELGKMNTLMNTSQNPAAAAAQNKPCASSILGPSSVLHSGVKEGSFKRSIELEDLDVQRKIQLTEECAPKRILRDMKNMHGNLPQTSPSSSISKQVMISSHVESQRNSTLTGAVSDACSRVYHHSPDENRSCLSRHTSKFRKGKKLLGNFEESILKGCLPPVNRVKGFQAEIGASGSFCPDHLTVPADVHFYEFGSPHQGATLYMAHVTLGDIEYYLPKKGAVQVTLFNPSETVVKMFVLNYDLSDMPPLCHTFMRQKIYYMPIGSSEKDPSSQKWLRFIIHIRFASTRTGKIYLHNDFKIVVLNKSNDDAASDLSQEPRELRSFLSVPTNPTFSNF